MGMGEFAYSMQMRDTIKRMIESILDSSRPKPRYAFVTAVNWGTNKCTVQYTGDDNPVIVNTGKTEPMVGQIVRIEGIGTDKYVADIVGSHDSSPITGQIDPLFTAGNPQVILDGTSGALDPRTTCWNSSYSPAPGDKIIAFPTRNNQIYIQPISLSTANAFARFIPPNLQNGWVAYGSGYKNPGFTKTDNGIVSLSGTIKGGTKSNGVILFELPTGFRPSSQYLSFVVCGGSNNQPVVIDVREDGKVSVKNFGGAADNAYLSLDGICFPEASLEESLTWDVPTYQTGFENLGNPKLPDFSFAKDSLNTIWHRGFFMGNTTPVSESIALIRPTGYAPDLQLHTSSASNTLYTSTDIRPTGGTAYKSGGYDFISLSGKPYILGGTSGWTNIPYLGTWTTHIPGSFSPASFFKRPDGMVILRGLVKRTGTDSLIATLPAGTRPKSRLMFTSSALNAFARIDILPTGVITLVTGSATSWVSLDSIAFMPEQ